MAPKRVRLVDVARAAQVSRATASKVLLGSGGENTRFSGKTAERVRRVAEKLEFRPNVTAQTLAGKRTRVIGAVVDAHAGLSSVRKLQAIEQIASDRGYRLLVGYIHDSYDKIAEFANDLYDREVEGVICMAHIYPEFGHRIGKLFRRFPNRIFMPAPVVDEGDTCVSVDFRKLAYLAAAHLLRLGRRRIVLTRRHGDVNDFRVKDWDEGFRAAHVAHGVELEPWQIVTGESSLMNRPRLASACAGRVLELRADGVVTPTDTSAMWLMGELRRRGCAIPEDLSIVSCQREPEGWASDIRLTSVDRREQKVASQAIECLLRQISLPADQPRPQQSVLVPPRLVVGDSCGAKAR
ncbi:MAG: LacI family DNA-binding transcriptional regulator [Planctomycetota bacterium]